MIDLWLWVYLTGVKKMSTITIGKDGVEFIHTNVIVPRHLRDLAKERGISLSKELRQALEEKLNHGSEQ